MIRSATGGSALGRGLATVPPGFVVLASPAPCGSGCPGLFDFLHGDTGFCLGCMIASGWTPGHETSGLTTQERGAAVYSVRRAWGLDYEEAADRVNEYAIATGRPFDSVLSDFARECGGKADDDEPSDSEKLEIATRTAELRELRRDLQRRGLPYTSAFDHPNAPEPWHIESRRARPQGLTETDEIQLASWAERKARAVA